MTLSVCSEHGTTAIILAFLHLATVDDSCCCRVRTNIINSIFNSFFFLIFAIIKMFCQWMLFTGHANQFKVERKRIITFIRFFEHHDNANIKQEEVFMLVILFFFFGFCCSVLSITIQMGFGVEYTIQAISNECAFRRAIREYTLINFIGCGLHFISFNNIFRIFFFAFV